MKWNCTHIILHASCVVKSVKTGLDGFPLLSIQLNLIWNVSALGVHYKPNNSTFSLISDNVSCNILHILIFD